MSGTRKRLPRDPEAIVTTVRERYGRLAAIGGSCCAQGSCCGEAPPAASTTLGYDAVELADLPHGADLGLGCGAPIGLLELEQGEVVLDLGSGAGIDVQLAARKVGPSGRAIGVDMTPEMLRSARALAERAGLDNVELREGRLESLPLEDASVDAVTSNCVINLVPDKGAVFAEIARVLRPGGRLVVSDIVLDGELPEAVRDDVLAYVGCVAGAMRREAYFGLIEEAGLTEVEVLKDVDFLSLVGDAVPVEVAEAMAAVRVTRDDLVGLVRSVTYRAWKR